MCITNSQRRKESIKWGFETAIGRVSQFLRRDITGSLVCNPTHKELVVRGQMFIHPNHVLI